MPHILPFDSAQSALVVDFDRVWSKQLCECLNATGLQVVECQSVRSAIAHTMQRRPDIVYQELLLHDDTGKLSGGGYLLCDQLRRLNQGIPLVVVTDVDLPDAALLAEKVGASAFYTKPIAPRVLIKQTATLLDPSRKAGRSQPASQQSERIMFRCYCGRNFRMCPSRRHERIACPECGESVSVPA